MKIGCVDSSGKLELRDMVVQDQLVKESVGARMRRMRLAVGDD